MSQALTHRPAPSRTVPAAHQVEVLWLLSFSPLLLGDELPTAPTAGKGGGLGNRGKEGRHLVSSERAKQERALRSSSLQAVAARSSAGAGEEPARPSWNVKAAVGVAKGQGEN